MSNHFLAIAIMLFAPVSAPAVERPDATTRPHDRPAHEPIELHAGPVRVKFSEGELRYLRVGDEEIVRRIYFAVRDGHWNTVMPTFTRLDVDDQHDHFTIHLAAQCRDSATRYQWTGTITGETDGTIKYAVEGTAQADFAAKRIGLCVLYGTPQFAGRSFETSASADAPAESGTFSKWVDAELLASDYQTMRCDTASGLHLTCTGSGSGLFRMEDQRNYGDSSYKAYFPIVYPYPKVSKGSAIAQVVTIKVSGAAPQAPARQAVQATHVRLGGPIAGTKLPHFLPPDPAHRSPFFYSVNLKRATFHDASVLLWRYTPVTHLPDDDMALENLPTVLDQAATARQFAPRASLHVAPITLDPPVPHPDRLPSRPRTFAAAWATVLYGNMARAGISKLTFDVSGQGVEQAIKSIEPYVGRPLLEADLTPGLPLTEQGTSPIQAFAAHGEHEEVVWLVNLTAQPREAYLDNLAPSRHVRVLRINEESTSAAGLPEQRMDHLDSPNIAVGPWEVCRFVFER